MFQIQIPNRYQTTTMATRRDDWLADYIRVLKLNTGYKFRFSLKIFIFDQYISILTKITSLGKISIFDQNVDFWRKFRFLTKTLILAKISIFD